MSQTADSSVPLSGPPSKGQAGRDPYSFPLEKIDVADAELFETDTLWGYFERLRKEDPVHYCAESDFGAYWSVTRFEDILHVEKNPEIFSSQPTIVVSNPQSRFSSRAGLHRDGRPSPPRPSQGLPASGGPPKPRDPRAPDPRARRRDPRRSVRRRDLQLGRARLHRAHDGHVGHALRLPSRGEAQADLLVRHGDRQSDPARRGGVSRKRSDRRRSWSASSDSRRSGSSARTAHGAIGWIS